MMKKIYGFVAVAALALVAGGCNSSKSADDMVDYIPVQEEEDGKWSLLGPDGKLKYADEFKEQPSSVVNGYFSVKEGEGYTLYKAGEKPEAVKNCDGLKYVGYMSEGLVPVVRDKSRITLVDGSGADKFTLEPVKGKEIVYSAPGYEDGMLLIQTEEDNYGFVNTKGEAVVKPVYTSAYSFSEGLAIVAKDEKTIVIDKKGETVISIKKDWRTAGQFSHGVLLVIDNNDHILFMDKKGETQKCPAKVKSVTDYNEDYYVFSDGDNSGVMSRADNEVMIRAKYSFIQIMDGNRFLCNDDKKHQILNAKGEVEKELDEYEYAYYLGKFGIVGKEKNSYVVLDDNGEMKKGCEFKYIAPYSFTASGGVYSDYFSIEAMANGVVERFTANGFDKIKIGMKPSAFLSNPRDYEYTYRISPDSLGGKGYRYSYTTTVEFTGRIADSHYNYDYYSYDSSWTYTWSDATVESILVNVEAETTLGESAVKAVVGAFEKKGFKVYATVYKDGTGRAMLTNKETLVIVESAKNSTALTAGMLKLPNAETLANIKKSMNEEEVSASAYDGDTATAAEDIVEVVEEVVAVPISDSTDW